MLTTFVGAVVISEIHTYEFLHVYKFTCLLRMSEKHDIRF